MVGHIYFFTSTYSARCRSSISTFFFPSLCPAAATISPLRGGGRREQGFTPPKPPWPASLVFVVDLMNDMNFLYVFELFIALGFRGYYRCNWRISTSGGLANSIKKRVSSPSQAPSMGRALLISATVSKKIVEPPQRSAPAG